VLEFLVKAKYLSLILNKIRLLLKRSLNSSKESKRVKRNKPWRDIECQKAVNKRKKCCLFKEQLLPLKKNSLNIGKFLRRPGKASIVIKRKI